MCREFSLGSWSSQGGLSDRKAKTRRTTLDQAFGGFDRL